MIEIPFILLSPTIHIQSYDIDIECIIDFLSQNEREIDNLKRYLTDDLYLIAIAIVAPELSQYSSFSDFLETKALSLLYVQQNTTNFSIGPFQMKPGFAEEIEQEIRRDSEMRRRFKELLIKKQDLKQVRRIRIERLTQVEWQTKYLAAFITIAEKSTKDITFDTNYDKLCYWATLYNAGLNLNESSVKDKQLMPEFLHKGKRSNYSKLSLYYYKELKTYFNEKCE